MSLPCFRGATKKQDDLLTKGYPYGSFFALALYNKANPVSFTGKTALLHGSSTPNSKLQFGYKVGDFDVKESITDKAEYKLNTDYVLPKNKDVTLSGEVTCGVGGPHFSLSAQQILQQARFKLTVTDTMLTTLSVVAGKPEQGVGFNVAVDKALKLQTYDAVAFLRVGQVDLALRHVSKPADKVQLGNIVLSMYQQLKPKVTVAAKATLDLANKDKPVTAEAAVRVEMSEKRSLAVKAQCSGLITVAHRMKLSNEVTMLTSAQANPQRPQDVQFGFKVKVHS